MAWLLIRALCKRYLVAVNVIELSLFAWDKLQAKQRGWRVAERQLLTVALLGGTPAAFLASSLFHHKRRKDAFMKPLRQIAVFQVVCGLLLLNAQFTFFTF